MSGQDQDVEALADKQVGMSGNYKQVSIGEIQNVWKFLIRDDIERKISFLFGIARIGVMGVGLGAKKKRNFSLYVIPI